MITPTVGRVVLFYRHGKTQKDAGEQPEAAIIAHVWSDTCVNLAYFDSNGVARNVTSVPLYHDDGERPVGFFCEWMPYQKGQAAKTEELEGKLAGK
ncbi:MAG TPA: hypothetical protein PLW40_11500 [Syntrophales bacterium]|mgnify:CR=1 FL=1|nr:hypothetical protein [Syntrophales bacterium]HOM08293.1 hypothetical protein [Syntrophales bacterium]